MKNSDTTGRAVLQFQPNKANGAVMILSDTTDFSLVEFQLRPKTRGWKLKYHRLKAGGIQENQALISLGLSSFLIATIALS